MTDLTWATGPDSGCLGLTGNLLVSGGEHLAALDLSSWTLNYLGPGRPREQCLVLTVTTSPLGDAVFFASGALFNLTSRTWTYLPAPPTSFNMALVIQDAKTKRLWKQTKQCSGGRNANNGWPGVSKWKQPGGWFHSLATWHWRRGVETGALALIEIFFLKHLTMIMVFIWCVHCTDSPTDSGCEAILRWGTCCSQGWHTQRQLRFHHPFASLSLLEMVEWHQWVQKVTQILMMLEILHPLSPPFYWNLLATFPSHHIPHQMNWWSQVQENPQHLTWFLSIPEIRKVWSRKQKQTGRVRHQAQLALTWS